MRSEFDIYVRRDSWLHRLDPRVKLLFVVEATVFLFLWPSIGMAVGVATSCIVILLTAAIPASEIVRIWRAVGVLAVMVFLLTALFGGGGQVLLRVGPFRVTSSAVQQGALLAVRLLALAQVFSCWLLTTDQSAMVRGFVALRVPYTWGLTLGLALRYLPIFAGQYEQVREAQAARGLDLQERSFVQRLRAYQPVLIAMLIIALRNSEQLGWALEARALGAHDVQRSVFRPLHMCSMDWYAFAVLIVALLAGIALRVL